MKKTLYMTFALDNGKKKQIALANPKAGLAETDVRPVMTSMVTRHALTPGGAALAAVDAAVVREVKDTKLI
ncbi:MAG: DUF2922 domain-containing protein [Schwartzia sp. (in: firmicutes)]